MDDNDLGCEAAIEYGLNFVDCGCRRGELAL